MHSDIRWLLVDALIKVTVILIAGCAMSFAMFHASAARRHLVWLMTIASALLIPILCTLLPGWHVLPTWGQPSRVVESIQSASAPPASVERLPISSTSWQQEAMPRTVSPPSRPVAALPSAARKPMMASAPRNAAAISAWRRLPATYPITIALLIFWFFGCLFLLGKVLISWLSLRRLARISTVAPDNYLTSIMQDAAGDLKLHRPVRLLISQDRAMPMTWGIVRPTILLPADAQTWPRSRVRLVLLHELAHVKRRDALAQLLSQIAGAIYWFHPLIWPAIRGLARQQESAADDLVLKTQASPAEYAGLLLDLAASLRASARVNTTAMAMARPFALEGRLKAVLESNHPRSELTVVNAVGGILVMFATIAPLASLRVRAQAVAAEQVATPTPNPISFAGHVLSADGKPVSNAEIFVLSEFKSELSRTRSAADGSFVVVPPVPLDRFHQSLNVTVRESHLGFGAANLSQGEDTVVHLRPSTSVRLTLLNPEGKPAAGVRIRPSISIALGAPLEAPEYGWIAYSADWFKGPEFVTNTSGECTIPMLPQQTQTEVEIDDLRSVVSGHYSNNDNCL